MDNEIETEGAGLSLVAYGQILRRRWLIVLQSIIVVGVAGTIITLLTKPVYEANARLVVEPPAVGVSTVDSSNPLSSILTMSPTQDVATQVAELQALPLLEMVQRQAGKATFKVQEEEDTNVISVAAQANTPKVATDAANALLQDYLQTTADNSLTEIRNALHFASARAVDAHQRLLASEAQLEQFKQANNITDIDTNVTALQTKEATLSQQLDTNQSNLNAIESQIAAERKLLAEEPATVAVTLRSTNPDIATITDQISKLEVQRVSMTQKGGYTNTAGPVLAIDAQIAEYKRQLASEPSMMATVTGSANPVHDQLHKDLATLESQEAAAKAQVAASKLSLNAAKAELVKAPMWQLAYEKLMRAHDSAQNDDKIFSENASNLSLREQAYHAPAHILEAAQVAQLVRPKKLVDIVLSLLLGTFLGCCLALLQEVLDDRINSVEETGRLLELPALGAIPVIADGTPRLLSQMEGLEPAAESYRSLRTNIHFASVDAPVETLLVTSSNPSEGKSTTAVNMAMAMALDGKSVILVDADLRRSTLHKVLELLPVPGLTDVLLGHATLDEALQTCDTAPNLQLLPAGSVPPNPSEVLSSRSFSNLVQKLISKADIVIFDSPPVLIGADASIIASQVDATVLVVEANGTKKMAAKHAVERLRMARARLIGISYNKMTSAAGYYYYYNHYSYYSLPADQQQADTENRRPRRPMFPENGKRALTGPREDEK